LCEVVPGETLPAPGTNICRVYATRITNREQMILNDKSKENRSYLAVIVSQPLGCLLKQETLCSLMVFWISKSLFTSSSMYKIR